MKGREPKEEEEPKEEKGEEEGTREELMPPDPVRSSPAKSPVNLLVTSDLEGGAEKPKRSSKSGAAAAGFAAGAGGEADLRVPLVAVGFAVVAAGLVVVVGLAVGVDFAGAGFGGGS